MFRTPERMERQAPTWKTLDAQSATGVANAKRIQLRSMGAGSSRPPSRSVPSDEYAMTGMERTSAIQKRRRMSASMAAAIRGSDMSWPIASWPPCA